MSPSPSPSSESPTDASPQPRRKPSRSRSNPFVRLAQALNAPGPYPIAPGQLPPSREELAHDPHPVPAAVQLPSALAAAAAVADSPPPLPAPSPWSQELLASCPPHVLAQLQDEVSAMLARVGGELRRAEKQVARLRRERDAARAGGGASVLGEEGVDELKMEVDRLRGELAAREEVLGRQGAVIEAQEERLAVAEGRGGGGASEGAGQREPPPEYQPGSRRASDVMLE